MGLNIQYSDERELPVQPHEQPLFERRYEHWIIKQNGGSFGLLYEQSLKENVLEGPTMLWDASFDAYFNGVSTNSKISGRNRFLHFIKSELKRIDGLVIPPKRTSWGHNSYLEQCGIKMIHNLWETLMKSTIVIYIESIGTFRVKIASHVVRLIYETNDTVFRWKRTSCWTSWTAYVYTSLWPSNY